MANIIDAEERDGILGTLAGADTLIVICKDEQTAKYLENELSLSKQSN